MIMEGEKHDLVKAKGLFAGLEFIFNRWKLPPDVAAKGPVAVTAYYEQVMNKDILPFDFSIKAPK